MRWSTFGIGVAVFTMLAVVYLVMMSITIAGNGNTPTPLWMAVIIYPLSCPLMISWHWVGGDLLKTLIPETLVFVIFAVVDLSLWSWGITAGWLWLMNRKQG